MCVPEEPIETDPNTDEPSIDITQRVGAAVWREPYKSLAVIEKDAATPAVARLISSPLSTDVETFASPGTTATENGEPATAFSPAITFRVCVPAGAAGR